MKASFRPALAAVLLAAGNAAATYVFTTVEYPGAVETDVRAINGSGLIAGYASLDGATNFSFTYQAGTFTPLAPSPFGPSALGMNDAGTIVGATSLPPGAPEQGFIYHAGTYTYFSRPGWTNTEARAINNAGLVTGWSYELDGSGGYAASSGFIYNPATASYVDIPIAGSDFTIAQGINAAGQVVGSARLLPGGEQGFLRQPAGTIALFTVNGSQTRARGISDTGLITGFVTDALGEHGFVGDSLGFQLLDVPSAAGTVGEGINDSGQVSGLWFDVSGTSHGFIATPAVLPTGTTSGGAYTFSVAVVPDVPIFIDPKVAVGYDYAIGLRDPRVAAVQLPIGVGDSSYLLHAEGRKFVVAGGAWFDFRANGFPKGVAAFRVGCIEASAALDPANSQAFVTGLKFVAAGKFTGYQKPIARQPRPKEPARCLDDDGDDSDD